MGTVAGHNVYPSQVLILCAAVRGQEEKMESGESREREMMGPLNEKVSPQSCPAACVICMV